MATRAAKLPQQLVAAVLFAATYFALSLVWSIQSHGSISNLVWLPAGLGPAALARWPDRWPGILSALVAAEIVLDVTVFAPDEPRYWIQWPIVNVIAALAGYWLLRRTGSDLLDAPRKMLGLVAAGAAVGAAFGLSTLLDGSAWVSVITAAAGDFAGFLIVAPVVLSLARDHQEPVLRAVLLLGALLVGFLVLWVVPDFSTRSTPWAAVMIALACAAAAVSGIEIASLTLIFVVAALTDSAAWAGFLGEGADDWSGVLIRLSMAVFVVGLGTLALIRDAAAQREREAARVRRELQEMTMTDPLTGVGNRRSVPADTGSSDGTVVLLDIDNLKRINDAFDHAMGDRVIGEVASLLSASAPDDALVARIGGDEFLLLSHLSEPDAERFVAVLTGAVADAGTARELPVPVTLSTGIAGFSARSDTWQAVQRADLALATAKGRWSRRATFLEGMRESAASVVSIEARLTQALRTGNLRAHVQPIVHTPTGEVEALEVLARMMPEGSPGPAEFVPVAMRTGMGEAMDVAVLEDVLRHLGPGTVPLSINCSPQNLMRQDYAPRLLDLLARHGVEPGRIILEVTEDGIVQDDLLITGNVAELRAAGVRVALDDFGTRSSALTAVTTLNPQIVKVDISFVQAAAAGDPGASAIIQALVAMGRRLSMRVVAEGVETAEQSRAIAELGITLQQGYYFSRPMPASEWIAYTRADVPWQSGNPAGTPSPR